MRKLSTSNPFKGTFKIFNFRAIAEGPFSETITATDEKDIIKFAEKNIKDLENVSLLFRGANVDGIIYSDTKQVAKFRKVL